MGKRCILYGYEMKNNEYLVVPVEANTVRCVFDSYINGMALNAIAKMLTEKKIEYTKDRMVWDKNLISRMIENTHYKGDEEYPQIIDEKLFQQAFSRKNSLGGKRVKDNPETKFLKKILFCSSCGARIRRTYNNRTKKERWSCENNCKSKRKLDDSALCFMVTKVINDVIMNPSMLDVDTNLSSYIADIETIKKINEVRYLFDQAQLDFKSFKKVLFDCVETKFDCCQFDASVYTERLKGFVSQQDKLVDFDLTIIETIVEKVFFNADGNITIKFVNGTEIKYAERMLL